MSRLSVRSSIAAAVVAAACAFAPSQAQAITNSGFETGNFSGWNTTGSAHVTGTFAGVLNPSEGNYQAHLLNSDKNVVHLANFLGSSSSELAGLVTWLGNGSAIKQSFTITEASTLSFDWRFAVQKGFSLGSQAGIMTLNGDVYLLGDSSSTSFDSTVWVLGSQYKITDWDTFSIDLEPGSYTLGFASLGELFAKTSKLLIDDVRLEVIPEPVTAGLALLSVGALGLSVRRRRHAA